MDFPFHLAFEVLQNLFVPSGALVVGPIHRAFNVNHVSNHRGRGTHHIRPPAVVLGVLEQFRAVLQSNHRLLVNL
jgi:hypothetical protein